MEAVTVTEEEAAAAAAAKLADEQAKALARTKKQIERWVNAQSQIDPVTGVEAQGSMLCCDDVRVSASALSDDDRAAVIAELEAAGYVTEITVGGAVEISLPAP